MEAKQETQQITRTRTVNSERPLSTSIISGVQNIDNEGETTIKDTNSIETSSRICTHRESYASSRTSATPIMSSYSGEASSMSTLYAPPINTHLPFDQQGEIAIDDWDLGVELQQRQSTTLSQKSPSLSLINTINMNVDMSLSLNLLFSNRPLHNNDANISSKSDVSISSSVISINGNISRVSSKAQLDDIILAEMVYGHVYREMGRVLSHPNFNTGETPFDPFLYMRISHHPLSLSTHPLLPPSLSFNPPNPPTLSNHPIHPPYQPTHSTLSTRLLTFSQTKPSTHLHAGLHISRPSSSGMSPRLSDSPQSIDNGSSRSGGHANGGGNGSSSGASGLFSKQHSYDMMGVPRNEEEEEEARVRRMKKSARSLSSSVPSSSSSAATTQARTTKNKTTFHTHNRDNGNNNHDYHASVKKNDVDGAGHDNDDNDDDDDLFPYNIDISIEKHKKKEEYDENVAVEKEEEDWSNLYQQLDRHRNPKYLLWIPAGTTFSLALFSTPVYLNILSTIINTSRHTYSHPTPHHTLSSTLTYDLIPSHPH